MKRQAVILCGGVGTRLQPYTTVLPKPLMPIGNEAIVSILIRQLKRDGYEHVIIASGYLGELMESYLGDGSKYGLVIEYSREDKPLGTAGPLTLIDNLEDQFLLVNGDTLCTLDFDAFYTSHQKSGSAATIGTYKKFVKIDLGVLHFSDDLLLKEYVEKPEYTFDISMGIYVLNRDVIQYIPKGERFDLPDLMRMLVGKNIPVRGYRLEGTWYDIGRVEDYTMAQEAYEKNPDYFFAK
ncbi:MAG: sugar phosphate nucleotidyltransferase [Candidatus Uhrbacteria bacterium]|nr:sugar phosphate nucleotidyltransferase [Candidatus Uhrbacteria bacterium]